MDGLKKEIALSAKGLPKADPDGSLSRTYCFAPDFPGFSGHFPGYPILPAFIQVLTVISMAEEVRGRRLKLLSLEKAKFQAEIYPGRDVEVTYTEGRHKGTKSLDATLAVGGVPSARMLVTFEEET